MAPYKNILLAGAAGRLGAPLVSAFKDDSRFTLTILTRSSSTATFPTGIKVIRVADSFPESELVEAFKGQDAIISAISRMVVEVEKTMIDAAAKAGVRRFVPSYFGTDAENAAAVELLPVYFKDKLPVLEYLRSREGELSWSAFVTGPFWELAMQSGMQGFDLTPHKASILRPGTARWCTTTVGTIALAVKNSLLTPEKTANRFLYIASFTASHNEILAAYEKATGAKWEVEYVDPEEQKQLGQQKFEAGEMLPGVSLLLRYACSQRGYGMDYAEYRGTENELLGLPVETLEEAVRASLG